MSEIGLWLIGVAAYVALVYAILVIAMMVVEVGGALWRRHGGRKDRG